MDFTVKRSPLASRGLPWRLVVVYLSLGMVWILASDYILSVFIGESSRLTTAQTYKGWAYVTVTGALLYWLVVQFVAAHRRVESSLRESLRSYRSLLESINQGAWVIDPDGRTLYANERFAAMLGVAPDDLLTNGIDRHVPDGWGEVLARQLEARRGGRPGDYELKLIRADGRELWANVYANPVFDRKGTFQGVVRLLTDHTERKHAAEALAAAADFQRKLLDELNHRVRNNLASLLSLVDVTRQATPDADEFAGSMRTRIRALADGHSLLADAKWSPVPIRAVLDIVLRGVPIRDRVHLQGPDAYIAAERVTSLAVVLHELLANSLRHGALRTSEGEIHVSWLIAEPQGGPPRLELHWSEAAAAPISAPTPGGAGLSLVAGLVRSDLQGEFRADFPASGARFELSTPAATMAPDPAPAR